MLEAADAFRESGGCMTGLADLALATLKDAVIRVGDGRGFIVEHGHDVLVIKAALS